MAEVCGPKPFRITADVLTAHMGLPGFRAAVSNVPAVDIAMLRRQGCPGSDDMVAQCVALHKWMSRNCNLCGAYDSETRCKKCNLVFYCTEEHRQKNKKAHRLRCCRRDGPADTAPGCLTDPPPEKK